VTDSTVLVVEHEAGAPAGWFGDELRRAGCRLDVRRPYDGEGLPGEGELVGVDGVVVLGGAVAAWEDELASWLPDTRALVRTAEQAGVPVLGICLGHQLATRALGGEVAPNPAGTTLAVLPVCWSEDAADDALFGAVLDVALGVHWNNDVVSALPAGARALATSPDGAVQAARLGESVWGVQFHPEAGPTIVERWVREDGAPYVEAGFDLEGFLADVRSHETELAHSCAGLARSFGRLVAAR
jgi:GMP synthase (glutamine-hydrolysing)